MAHVPQSAAAEPVVAPIVNAHEMACHAVHSYILHEMAMTSIMYISISPKVTIPQSPHYPMSPHLHILHRHCPAVKPATYLCRQTTAVQSMPPSRTLRADVQRQRVPAGKHRARVRPVWQTVVAEQRVTHGDGAADELSPGKADRPGRRRRAVGAGHHFVRLASAVVAVERACSCDGLHVLRSCTRNGGNAVLHERRLKQGRQRRNLRSQGVKLHRLRVELRRQRVELRRLRIELRRLRIELRRLRVELRCERRDEGGHFRLCRKRLDESDNRRKILLGRRGGHLLWVRGEGGPVKTGGNVFFFAGPVASLSLPSASLFLLVKRLYLSATPAVMGRADAMGLLVANARSARRHGYACSRLHTAALHLQQQLAPQLPPPRKGAPHPHAAAPPVATAAAAAPTHPMSLIRNLGIIAHIDAGKTTTSERMLYYAGVTSRYGEVHDGNTVLDFMPQERERGITIQAAAVTFGWASHTLNLIDTPGHVDFTLEVERSMRVIDGAVALFDAVSGVEAQSETVWRQADRHGVPRIAFANKMDRDGASYEGTARDLVKRLGATPLKVHLPLGEAGCFAGVVDLVDLAVVWWEDREGKRRTRRSLAKRL